MLRPRMAAATAVALCLTIVGCSDSGPTGPGSGRPVTLLDAGGNKTCAMLENSTTWCWGLQLDHFPGTGGGADSVPVHREALDGSSDIVINGGFWDDASYCWTDDAGRTRCRGAYASFYDIGAGYPMPPLGFPSALKSMATAWPGGCGLDDAGAAWCWGSHIYGRRGGEIPPDTDDWSELDPNRAAAGLTFVQLVVGEWHTCGRTAAGAVLCWGDGPLLGDSSSAVITGDICWFSDTCALDPVQVANAPQATDISANHWLTCATLAIGQLRCWTGYPGQAEFYGWTPGPGPTPDPHLVPLPFTAVDIELAKEHACALDAAGKAWCWGVRGPWLGTASIASGVLEVETSVRFTRLTLGGHHTCGISTAGEAWCWGRNDYGQLGDGTTQDRYFPVKVAFR